MIRYTLAELAERLNCRLAGDGALELTSIRGLDEAEPGALSFVSNPRYAEAARHTRASALIVADAAIAAGKAALVTSQPYLAYAMALRLFHPLPAPRAFQHPSAVVDESASIGQRVFIGANAVIEAGVVLEDEVRIEPLCFIGESGRIGAGTTLKAGVLVMNATRIGKRCLIHGGTVIGSDGFGFAFHEGRHHKVPQVGNVEIGDDVEIGSNVSIDRATTGVTSIGDNVIIDNLVQIAHNVKIGQGSVIVSQTGISGSTTIGKYVTLAGQTGTIGHITIGDRVTAAGRAGIDRDIPAGATVFGFPPVDHMAHKRQLVALQRLPELLKTVRTLEKRLAALEGPHATDDEQNPSA